ncbi:MAG TPA: hypothetical protein VL463_10380 [Kofleriaceae bacterium]|jgi:hypothetical protein|nr:hypothetical protein [Kofleriaceae bacterium]
MLKRLAASLLSLALLAPVANADFAKAPPTTGELQPITVSREAVRAALSKRREHNLAAFHAYRTAGVYPHNYRRPGPLNVWLDVQGHLCAAATMIDKDGFHKLVMETAKTDNAIRLANVTDGALMDWILTSGFTLEEIDRIQLPMDMPGETDRMRPVDWRISEDTRLKIEYRATEAWLKKHAKRGLDEAVDRLMEHPELAAELVGPSLA